MKKLLIKIIYWVTDNLDMILIGVLVVLIAFVIGGVGYTIGLETANHKLAELHADYFELTQVVKGHANRSFTLSIQGRKLEIYDSLGLIDSVNFTEKEN